MNELPISPRLLVLLAVMTIVVATLAVFGKVPLRYNLRSLVVRWPITLMTAFAFTAVIGLLIAMLSLVNGMYKLTEGSGVPENVIVLADGANDEAFSSLSFTDTTNIGRKPDNPNESYPASKELYIIASMPISAREGQAARALKGRVKKVYIDRGEFILTDEQDRDLTVRLADDGRVLANSQEGKLENLKPADNVWLAYEERGGVPYATEVRGSNRRRFVQVRGIEDPYVAGLVHGLDLLEGSWFGAEGVVALPNRGGETAIQAVIGDGLARELGPDLKKPRLEVGDVFELGQRQWQVVGITRSEGTTFSSEVWAKRANVGELYGKPATVSSIVIRTSSAREAEQLAEYLRTDFKEAKLQTQTETEYYSKLQGVNAQFLGAAIFFTVFMAIGGIFGVMNTMYAAVSHRSKDIGVLRILGYARWQILASFLLESLVIAAVGGLLGCALGSLVHGWTMTSLVGSGQGGFGKTVILRLLVNPNTLAVGIFLTLLMGFLGGLLPSLMAMRVRPLESLR